MYAGYILKEVLPSECHLQSVVPTGQKCSFTCNICDLDKGACEKVVYMQKQKPQCTRVNCLHLCA
jgi:hypothetical protein